MSRSFKKGLLICFVTLGAVVFVMLLGNAVFYRMANPPVDYGYSDYAVLDNECKTLYQGTLSGSITKEKYPDAKIELPSADLSSKQRKDFVSKMTVEDAVIFCGNDPDYFRTRVKTMVVDYQGNIYRKDDKYLRQIDNDIELSLDTTFYELYLSRPPFILEGKEPDGFLNDLTKEYYAKIVSGDITREDITDDMGIKPERLPEKDTPQDERYKYAAGATLGEVIDFYGFGKYYDEDTVLSGLVASKSGGIFTREYAEGRGIEINEDISLSRSTRLGKIFAVKEPVLYGESRIMMMSVTERLKHQLRSGS